MINTDITVSGISSENNSYQGGKYIDNSIIYILLVLIDAASLLRNTDTELLDFCKYHQKGRVSKKDTTVSFEFTEGWFRDSGLYDLTIYLDNEKVTSFSGQA